MCDTMRIPDAEIDNFMRVCKSARDDSRRCRQFIGQLRYDKRELLAACEAMIVGVVSCTDAGWTDEERALAERFGADGMNLADIITGARAAIAKAKGE